MPVSPMVTVVLCTYNRAHLVGRAIRSIVGQTLQDWELLVVDDASSDGTEEAVRAFADPRVRYVRREANGGLSASRNTGMSMAAGRYVAFLDDDDEYLPNKLERQVAYLEDDAAAGLGGVEHAWQVVDPGGKAIVAVRTHPLCEDDVLFNRVTLSVVQLLLRRDRLEDLRFDESLVTWEDWDFLLRFLRRHRLGYMQEPLMVVYRDHGPRMSASEALVRGMRSVLDKYDEEFSRSRRLEGFWNFKLAVLLIKRGELAEGRSRLLHALRLWPFRPERWLLLGMSWRRSATVVSRTYAHLASLGKRVLRLTQSDKAAPPFGRV
jgi:glycosyltransferase involved in cell wall biosynthesis